MNKALKKERPDQKPLWSALRWRSSAGGAVLALVGVLGLVHDVRQAEDLSPNSAEAFEFRPRAAPDLPAPELA